MSAHDDIVIDVRDVSRTFRAHHGKGETRAVAGISFEVRHGALCALVGPDGAGKSTLLRMMCGLIAPTGGELRVLGLDAAREAQAIQDRISYMPQRFGLYEDLSVQENLDLYADLHGVSAETRKTRYARLMEMTDLGPFRARLAGKLSGGMKQKLGLACTLVRAPELLLLDEPTVGVDPLSRRELWEIIAQLRRDEGLTVIMSTAYLDEAERCDTVQLLREGRILASGNPAQITHRAEGLCHIAEPREGEPARVLQARLLEDREHVIDAVPWASAVRFIARDAAGVEGARASGAAVVPIAARLEDGVMVLLREAGGREPGAVDAPVSAPSKAASREIVIEVEHLVRKFGDFVAVADTSFDVRRGEVFGLLGPNGAGKTTSFRMLCGLLPATSGRLRVAGVDVRTARASARRRIGYVSQKFALYGSLSALENLQFFAGAYGLDGSRAAHRIDMVLEAFELGRMKDARAQELPGGYRQRLAMAAALLHEPEILFLDEPTSGADPLARREFWLRITHLAQAGTTVVVTTHFMEEAEYCDRIAIQDAGRMLAVGTPDDIRRRAQAPAGERATVEDAFIAIVEEARRERHEERQAA